MPDDFIRSTNLARQRIAFDLFQAVLRAFGYNRIWYSLIADHRSLGLLAGHGVIRSYTAEWMRHNKSNHYERLTGIHCHVLHNADRHLVSRQAA